MKLKALIIDDDPDMSEVCKTYLESAGFETIYCADGRQGLEKALEYKPNLLIIDLMMPNIHGYEVCERIRANPDLKDAKILVTSSKSFDSDRELALRAGADDYLIKPYLCKDLLDKVDALLST